MKVAVRGGDDSGSLAAFFLLVDLSGVLELERFEFLTKGSIACKSKV